MITRRALALLTAFAALSVPLGVQAQDAPTGERFSALLNEYAKAGIVRTADIRYAAIEGADPSRLLLDVYTKQHQRKAPVIIFFHGGSWQTGNKGAIGQKPLTFVPSGYVMVSATYRFRPSVTVAEMAGDVARAVAWTKANIGSYGGDSERIFLMGHSAGAHLVSLVGTNELYLKASGLGLDAVSGVISLDTGPYDVPLQIERVRADNSQYAQMIRFVFTENAASYPAISPVSHVEKAKGIPPFLVVASDNRADMNVQALPFVQRLVSAGVEASLYVAEGRTHASLNAELGAADDPTTLRVLSFLRGIQ